MRIKIFLFPIIVIVALYLVIAQVFPDLQRTRLTRESIAQKEVELAQEKERQTHITELYGSFAQNDDDYQEVFTAVPQEREAEFMINQVGKLVQNHGMTLTLMGFQDSKQVTRRSARVVSINGDESASRAEPQKIQISANIAGSYENMRKFLAEVFFLGRAGQFLNVDVERIDAEENEQGEATPQDYLTTTIVFDYYVMPKFNVSNPQTFTDPLIENTQSKFDYSRAAAWRESLTKDLSGIAPIEGEHGSNPFLP